MDNKYRRLTLLSPEEINSFQYKDIFILTNHNQGYKSKDDIEKQNEF
jgi:hypothetical protein